MGSLQDALLKTGLADERRTQNKKGGGASAGKDKPPRGRNHKTRNSRARISKDDNSNSNNDRKVSAGNKPARRDPGKARPSDLERAWIARRKAEKDEKERVKQARVADQEARRKRNLELDAIVEGKALNVEDADLPRYFQHLGRIRRVMCTPEQRNAINSGQLGIVSLRGRYLIVEPDVLSRYQALAEDLVPDLSGAEPEAESEQDTDYPPVPDDLTW